MTHILFQRRYTLIGVLIVFLVAAGLFFLSPLLLPSPQGSAVQPSITRAPERIMIYGGELVGRTDILIRVQLDQKKIVAGFPVDDLTQVLKVVKSTGFTLKKMSHKDIPIGASLSVSVITDPKSKELKVRQIVYQ